MDQHLEYANLSIHQLKESIKSEWKKHEEAAREDLAPLLYYLRENLKAQGARNDLNNSERGFEAWVEDNLDFSRRTADRWCEWFAVEAGIKPGTSRQVPRSDDDPFYDSILNEHKGQEQIAFNCWVPKSVHAQFTKALTKLQKQFNLKNKKEAMVRGVIYAATAINEEATGGRSSSLVGRVSLRQHGSKTHGNSQVRGRVPPAHGGRKTSRHVPVVAGGQGNIRDKHVPHRSHGHRGGSGGKVMRAAAGR